MQLDERRHEYTSEQNGVRMAVSVGDREAVAVFMERRGDGSVVVLDVVTVRACRS